MTKVAFGPANSAGQADQWANVLDDAFSFSFSSRPSILGGTPGMFDFPTTVRLPYPRLTTRFGRARRARLLTSDVSHLFLDGFAPVLGAVRSGLTLQELASWKQWGINVSLVAHGSDVRDIQRHGSESRDSFFHQMDPGLRTTLATKALRNRSVAQQSGLPLLVSTPDLLIDLPDARWLPLCVDRFRWIAPTRSGFTRPRFLHVPSSSLKGSDVIDPVLSRLAVDGVIDYVRASGVPHSQMPELVASVDVVVDQVRTGSYGVAAVEAMASGALVMGHVSPAAAAHVPDPIPVVQAPASQFEEACHRLLDERNVWPDLADQGRSYAEKYHSGERSRETLLAVIDGERR